MGNIFEKVELFSDFNEKQIKAIFKLGERRIIEANEYLFREGTKSEGLYVILGGKFSASYNDIKKFFTSGATLAEISLLDNIIHRIDMKSEQKSQYFIFTKEKYEKLKETSPKFALKLQENIINSFFKKIHELEKIFLEIK